MITVTEQFAKAAFPVRNRDSHKGDYGKVHILAGCMGFTGAPDFAAKAAVRTGSGLVYLHVPKDIWPVLAVKSREAMPAPVPPFPQLLDKLNTADAVLIGPGLGRSRKTDVRTLRLIEQVETPMILDADGLNALSGHIESLAMRCGQVTILTPHDGEFIRLRQGKPIGEDRITEAVRFAEKHSCILVLKGHRTITAFPDGKIYLNTTGNPGMAKGGSGDVLSGIILSLLGQGIVPETAVPAAVWLHGHAGDLAAAELGEYGMTPSDLLDRIPAAIRTLTDS